MVPLEAVFGKREQRVPDERELIGLRQSATQAHTLSNRNTEALALVRQTLDSLGTRLELLERPSVDMSEPVKILAQAVTESVGEVGLAVMDFTSKMETRAIEQAKQIEAAVAQRDSVAVEINGLRVWIETLRAKVEDTTALQEERKRNDGLHHELRNSLDRSLGHLEVRFTALEQSLGSALKASIEATSELNKQVLSLSERVVALEARPVITLDPAMEAVRQLSATFQSHSEQMDRHINDFADGLAEVEERSAALAQRTWWSLFKDWLAFWRK